MAFIRTDMDTHALRLLYRRVVEQGEVVRLRIVESDGPGKWLGIIGTRQLKVYCTHHLTPGSVYTCTIRKHGTGFRLQIIEPRSSPGKISTAESFSSEEEKIIHALAKSGLPALPGYVHIAKGILQRAQQKDIASRIIAILFDKGFKPTTDIVQFLTDVISGNDIGEERKRRGHDRKQGEKGTGDQKDSTTKPPSPVGIDSDVGNFLYCFNHVTAKHDNWIIIPFDEQGVSGRIILRTAGREEKTVRSCTLHIDLSFAKLGFILHLTDSRGKLLKIFCESSDIIRKSILINLPDLRQKLRNLGFEIDDTIYDYAGLDGFLEDFGESISRIDRRI